MYENLLANVPTDLWIGGKWRKASDGARFDVLLIQHSLSVTTWGEREVGARVNLEIDTMARYAARLAEAAVELG